jgi:hypothetical protein
MNDKLPMRAAVMVPGQNLVGLVDRGDKGYYPMPSWTAKTADGWNERHGVSHAQREAMLVGSMFGWDVPGADPDLYPNEGPLEGRS